MKERLRKLVQLFQENEMDYLNSDYNEQECRLEFIDTFLECFDWDVKNTKCNPPYLKEVLVEKYTEHMKRPDYTMTFHGITKFFVEAKKPCIDISINAEPSIQARKYGWNAKHKFALLTNFKDLYIYDTSTYPSDSDHVNVSLFKKYNYCEYVEKYDEIYSIIGRNFVYSEYFEEFLSSNFISNHHICLPVDKAFLNDINKCRINLANDLYLNNKTKYSDMNYLNDVIQDFINKIVFLRICEDRNLKTYQNLSETIKDEKLLKQRLMELFVQSDRKYNSGIFSDRDIIFDLNNEVIMSIVKELYYPKSPYLFNIIEPNVLGEIYELFLTEQLRVYEERVILEKKSSCLNRSIVTTPIEIVRAIVKNTVGNKIANLSPDKILEMSFIDIACGSGIFLEETYEIIYQEILKWHYENNEKVLEYSDRGEIKLPFNIKKKIMTKCIYGVDIDAQAVEVCKFSLLIKLLEGEVESNFHNKMCILPSLEENIKCGNSLVTSNLLSPNIISKTFMNINPFDWNSINDGNKFDCVIGNPPYVKTEDLHNLLESEELNIYKNYYFSAFKQFDKYYIFIERGLNLLKENGLLGMIVPNKFMKIDSAKKLRELLLKINKKIVIVDFGDSQLFEDKTIYSSILYLKNADNDYIEYSKCDSLSSITLNNYHSYQQELRKSIGNDVWAFSEVYKNTLSDYFIPLNKIVKIFNGIQTSMEKPHVYWISKSQIYKEDEQNIYFKFMDKKYIVEKSLLRLYFKPINSNEKGSSSYDILKTDKFIIYPYDRDGKLIDINTMKDKFPNCLNYFKNHYKYLVPKQLSSSGIRDVPNSNIDTWYQYGRVQGLTAFNNVRKIIVKNLFKIPLFSIDDADMILSSGGTAGYSAISLLENTQYSLEFIQAWLNCTVTVKILKDIASQFEGGFYAIGTSKLKKLRIIKLNFNDPADKKIHDSITQKVMKIRDISVQLEMFNRKIEKQALIKQREMIISEIDDTIKKLYEEKVKM
ncbi:MAG: restriction endonuclease subunit M [Erysipelotrichaceae bacterium]|nr:restriction endonuclease subunit M [Erysipelotrichaceae bacterium]